MMLKSLGSKFHKQLLPQKYVRYFADEAKATSPLGFKPKSLPTLKEGQEIPEFFRFTFSCPHKDLYSDAPVRMVAVPGSDGKFACTPGHIPLICEMQPGILSLYHDKNEASGRQDHFFVAGGICLIHPDGSMEVSAVEAVPLADLDTTNVKEGLQKAKDKLSKAQNDKDKLEAEIEMETYESIERSITGSGI